LRGTVEILSGKHFPCANILRGALKHNIPIGFSSRGLGSEHRIDDSTYQIGEDFELICYDAVVQPSTFGAFGRLNEHSSKKVLQRNRKINRISSIVEEILI
jgi:hypothetical protein